MRLATGLRFNVSRLSGCDSMALENKLLSTNQFFLLGRWLSYVPAWAHNPEDLAQIEYDAHSILTTWGDRTASLDLQNMEIATGPVWSATITHHVGSSTSKPWRSLWKAADRPDRSTGTLSAMRGLDPPRSTTRRLRAIRMPSVPKSQQPLH